jgi:hypothetical protein
MNINMKDSKNNLPRITEGILRIPDFFLTDKTISVKIISDIK